MEIKSLKKDEYIKYLDSLRLVACLLVIGIHTSAINWETDIVSWMFDCAVHYAVPIFVAISGACFIGKQTSYKKLLEKIIAILIAYFLWSAFYLIAHEKMHIFQLSILKIISRIISANYHMWYLRMLVFLYLFVPIVNEIYKKKGLFIYFTIFTLITSICFDQYVPYLEGHGGALQFLERMRFVMRPSYLIYFLLGALLRDWVISKKYKKLIIVLCVFAIVVGTVCAVCGTALESKNLFVVALGGGGTFTLSEVMYVIGIFTLFKIIDCNAISGRLSKYTFGIYLVHPFIISFLFTSVLKIPTLRSGNSIVDILINVFSVFVLSLMLSFIGSKIPIINQYVFLIKGKKNLIKEFIEKTNIFKNE